MWSAYNKRNWTFALLEEKKMSLTQSGNVKVQCSLACDNGYVWKDPPEHAFVFWTPKIYHGKVTPWFS